jgi:hypothetical protein
MSGKRLRGLGVGRRVWMRFRISLRVCGIASHGINGMDFSSDADAPE